MFCPECGARFTESDIRYCNKCAGELKRLQVAEPVLQNQTAYNDAPSFGFATLCFFLPWLGLILFLVWHDEKPRKAKSCGKGALFGVITWTVLTILCYVLIFVLAII